MSTPVADQQQREIARDPERSVIVQAPAGSGKTELLMQRYLALLSRVDEPEQILAVTFTRKAAAEMRHRILLALQPQQPDERLPETAQLAARVLERDRERNWRLLEFPARLRIRTFDSVNSWLTDSAPVSTGGSPGVVSERRKELYELAARRALEHVTHDDQTGQQASIVLRHLDNQADRFIDLMALMLERRDQWLPLLGSGALDAGARDVLEQSLRILVQRELDKADALLSLPAREEMRALLPYAADRLRELNPDHELCCWLDCEEFPRPEPEQIGLWRALANFCLVKNEPAFRKTVNKSNGFPTPKDGGDKTMTDRAKSLLAAWEGDAALADALHTVRALPEPYYTDAQWEALAAVIQVLPLVAAELSVVFSERGETDYVQIARAALNALADTDGPTGLALRLDYRIQHILIDEFQDTSRTQHRLLELLTEGWTGADGRTLMVVGDPMQSIYRFRQAEVSLYMQLWEQGIGALQLEPVRLSSNFRSAAPVVEWVNATFRALMPARSDPATGAVQFAEATPTRPATADSRVAIHSFAEPARVDEAATIGELVEETLANSATDTIGILVRTRHQARLIVPELRARGIAFSGAGLEQPGETAVEQDLIALTRALTHPGDRTAWLAMLRAPWCGLTLADLERLAGPDLKACLPERIASADAVAALSADGQRRVATLAGIVEAARQRRGKTCLRDWIEGVWQDLGGPAALRDQRDLELAEQYFQTLDEYDQGGDIAEAYLLHERLAAREDRGADPTVRVHLLTIFKAKGLEYDVVILPALDGTTRQDDKQVVAWHEFSDADNVTRYLMAPIEAVGEDSDPVQSLIRRFEREQAANERDRLLYVAATRAKKRLHLCFEIKRDKNDEWAAPRTGSLLERAWAVLQMQAPALPGGEGTAATREEWVQPWISRLVGARSSAPPAIAISQPAETTRDADEHEVTYEWASTDAMRVGSVVHRCLQYLTEQQLRDWDNTPVIARMLAEEGVAERDLPETTAKVLQAVQGTLADDTGRWLLSAHANDACEFAVTVLKDGAIERLVIDRTFVDEHDVRWIVDYKTSQHEGGDLPGFIARELERYAEQLAGYRTAMRALEPDREIRTALYFPLLGVFCEYDGAAVHIDPAS